MSDMTIWSNFKHLDSLWAAAIFRVTVELQESTKLLLQVLLTDGI